MWFKRPGNWFFIFPWIAFLPWYGMLIAMLIVWAAEGHPIYWFMDSRQFPVYISDIGATNLRPLFISCSGWQGLGYVITVALEFYQRSGYLPFRLRNSNVPKNTADEGFGPEYVGYNVIRSEYAQMMVNSKFYMPPWYTRDERNLIFAAFVLGCIGQLGLLFGTIFSTANYPPVHTAMITIFIVFMFLSTLCLTAEYFVLGRHYALVHPKADPELLKHADSTSAWKWKGHIWNKYFISALAKVTWLTLAVIWAICFAAVDNNSISGCFEWLLAFWFGIIFIILSVDFYLGGRYQSSKYFHQIQSFAGYYKYDQILYGSDSNDTENSELKEYITQDLETENALTV